MLLLIGFMVVVSKPMTRYRFQNLREERQNGPGPAKDPDKGLIRHPLNVAVRRVGLYKVVVALLFPLRVVTHEKMFSLPKYGKDSEMSLTFWLSAMFLLGLVAMGVMFLFLKACEKI